MGRDDDKGDIDGDNNSENMMMVIIKRTIMITVMITSDNIYDIDKDDKFNNVHGNSNNDNGNDR